MATSRSNSKSLPPSGTITIPYRPFPHQAAFHKSKADVTLVGGAAGPGKTVGIMWDAFSHMVRHPGNHGILLRRTYPELEKSLILESLKYFPKEICKYNDQKHRWTIQTGGAPSHLDFGFCENDSDVYKYQGAEFGFIGWDELTHFTEHQFTYLLSRLRSTVKGVRPIVKCTSNPGGVGMHWVKKYFGIGKKPENTLWRPDATPEDPSPLSRLFIPAKVTDNPVLMANDPNYVNRLKALPEHQRRMLLDGDWDVFSGQFFTEWNRKIHTVAPFQIPHHWKKYRAIDYGYTAPFACLWVAVSPEGRHYVYRELYQTGLTAKKQAEYIARITGEEQIEFTVCDPSMAAKRDGTSAQEEYLYSAGIALVKANNDRIPGWNCVRTLLAPDHSGKPLLQVFQNCPNLIREIEEAVTDTDKVEDLDTTGSDHALDALRYYSVSHPSATRESKESDRYKGLDEASKREWKALEGMVRKVKSAENSATLSELNRD